jgi:hypothetical protein
VRAVVTVAGLASGAAATPLTALTVMKRGPETDIALAGARRTTRPMLPGDACRCSRSTAATTTSVTLAPCGLRSRGQFLARKASTCRRLGYRDCPIPTTRGTRRPARAAASRCANGSATAR